MVLSGHRKDLQSETRRYGANVWRYTSCILTEPLWVFYWEEGEGVRVDTEIQTRRQCENRDVALRAEVTERVRSRRGVF